MSDLRELLSENIIIETRKGERYIKIGKNFVNKTKWFGAYRYNERLKIQEDMIHDFDIFKIFTINASAAFENIFNDENLYLIWERADEIVEMTIDDVCKALGKKVKIVSKSINLID